MKKNNVKTKKNNEKLKKTVGKIKIYVIITIGSFITALGINLFLSPLSIVAGGVSGVAIIVNSFTGFPIGIFMLLVNIPLFYIGIKCLGGRFGIKSFYGAISLSILTDLTSNVPVITQNLLLGAAFGGALLGIGMGLVFLTGATTGGSDVVAMIGNKLLPAIDMGKWLLIIDCIIISANAIVFEHYELALYGLVALYINSYLIDVIIQGANFAKIVYIISNQHEEISRQVMTKLSRGVTGLYAKGMYNNDDKIMLMCVVKKYEFQKLKQIVLDCDANAFIIITQAREVAGEGFAIYPMNEKLK